MAQGAEESNFFHHWGMDRSRRGSSKASSMSSQHRPMTPTSAAKKPLRCTSPRLLDSGTVDKRHFCYGLQPSAPPRHAMNGSSQHNRAGGGQQPGAATMHHLRPDMDFFGDSLCIANRGGKLSKHLLLGKARTLSLETKSAVTERLCATWPQSGTVVTQIEDLINGDEEVESTSDEDEDEERLQSLYDSKAAIEEWYIPYNDLTFKEMIRQGRYGNVYRGQWHGEVLIYEFPHCKNEQDEEDFWNEVACLSLIRHENIMLFMGACFEQGHFAVITSARKGPTLFEQVHLKREAIAAPSKLSIARQVAQAISYMHAKRIVHKRLNSHNIILENRIKVCVMDQGMPFKQDNNIADYGVVPRGQLTYLSPELVRSLEVDPPYLFLNRGYTPESDVYAFGTILYELAAYKFPFADQDCHTIIWKIGSGEHESLENLRCNHSMKILISSCWASTMYRRPSFSDILRSKILEDNLRMNKRFSSSEPETLHRAGLSNSPIPPINVHHTFIKRSMLDGALT